MSRITAIDTEMIEKIINDIEIEVKHENLKNSNESVGISELFKNLLALQVEGSCNLHVKVRGKRNNYKYVQMSVQSPCDLTNTQIYNDGFIKLPIDSITNVEKNHSTIDNTTSTLDILNKLGENEESIRLTDKHIFEKSTTRTKHISYGLTDAFSGNSE